MKHLLLTGKPGVGKTTLIKQIINNLDRKKLQGFYTQEVRISGSRVGFDIMFLDGTPSCKLARIENGPSATRTARVGRYSVYVDEFELHALPKLSKSSCGCYIIVDEIGKMEILSSKFKRTVNKLLCCDDVTLVGTIPVGENVPKFVKDIRNMQNVEIVEVTHGNRDSIFEKLKNILQL